MSLWEATVVMWLARGYTDLVPGGVVRIAGAAGGVGTHRLDLLEASAVKSLDHRFLPNVAPGMTARPGLHPVKALLAVVLTTAVFAGESGKSPEGIPRAQEEQIRAAAPDKPRVAPKRKRRVLIWSTPAHLMDRDPHKGYCVPCGLCAMRILGEKTGAFEPVIHDDIAEFLPENIRRFDAIVMNDSCGPWITPSDAAFTGHPWNEEVAVLNEEPGHPLVAAFAGKGFRIADEIFQFGPPYDRQKLRVRLSLDTERTNMGVKWIQREDNDFAQAWVKSVEKGRIFYAGFGHRTEIWWNPAILQFYLDAIQFAVGDLEGETAPSEE